MKEDYKTEYNEWIESLDDYWRLIFSYIVKNDFSTKLVYFDEDGYNLQPVENWIDANCLSNEEFQASENYNKIIELQYLPLSQIIERIFCKTHNKKNNYLFYSMDLSKEGMPIDVEKENSMKFGNIQALRILKNLKRIDLYGLQISDYSGFEFLENLEEIEFEGNHFIDFKLLNALSKLEKISFNFSIYPSTALESINEFENWQQIENLSFCGAVSITDYSFLKSAKNLKGLSLYDCKIGSMDFINYLISLQDLTLQGITIRDNANNIQLSAPSVETLHLTIKSGDETLLNQINFGFSFPNLKDLFLTSNSNKELCKTILENISACISLESLVLSDFQYSNFYYLANFMNLKSLTFYNSIIGDFDGIEYLDNLNILDITLDSENNKHTDKHCELISKLSNLEQICFSGFSSAEIRDLKYSDSIKYIKVDNELESDFFDEFENIIRAEFICNGERKIIDRLNEWIDKMKLKLEALKYNALINKKNNYN